MTQRKPLSKKARFEVFKRDKFTCQYCGASASDVVLEVDHIRPVADGGTNDITNLVTACINCNRGKGATKLDDASAVMKQKRQLEMLQERREQIEMMCEWQLSLVDETNDQIRSIESIIAKLTGSEFGFSDYGESEINKLIARYGFQTVADATRQSFSYYRHETEDEREYALDKIPGICFYMTNKRCSQCKYHEEYDRNDQTVTCSKRRNAIENDYAEKCKHYESMFAGGSNG